MTKLEPGMGKNLKIREEMKMAFSLKRKTEGLEESMKQMLECEECRRRLLEEREEEEEKREEEKQTEEARCRNGIVR